ncbi:hypothetical protein RJG79_02990 [Mycoplasmatota bacterium WC44]
MKLSNAFKLLLLIILVVSLLSFCEHGLYTLAYIVMSIYCTVRLFTIKGKISNKIGITLLYLMLLSFQISFSYFVVFVDDIGLVKFAIAKAIATIFLALPFIVEEAMTVNKYATISIPNLVDKDTFSFETALKIKDNVPISSIAEVAKDLPRHKIYTYGNKNSLHYEYFYRCEKSLENPFVYLVLSDTGSSASNLIKIATGKNYNHISLSFDKELQTIVSYNGGEKLYPPGLNEEMIEYFNKKKDASIYVYKLPVTMEQKEIMINYIKNINESGSSYNIIGLLTKTSRRKNIMFCSQFVYNVLCAADAQYFDKIDTYVKPTDFVELDYKRKLQFEKQITFSLYN